MPWAVVYTQDLDPLHFVWLSRFLAATPVLVLFYLLVGRRWLASKAGAAGAVVAILIAWAAYGMPLPMATMAFVHGAGFGLLPVGWTVINAMLLYNITVATGQFTIIRRSVAGLSADARVQAILIGFAFGAFLEGAAGSGSPVAVCGAMLVGLGFRPFEAAVICLIANTSPVAYGGLGTPIITLQGVTDLPGESLSVMAAHQLPFMSVIIPFYMVKRMCTWRQTFAVWPALAVAGGSFASFQYFCGTAHTWVNGLVIYPMTDVAGGIFSLLVTAVFLKFWKPRELFRYPHPEPLPGADVDKPLTAGRVALAWLPFALMSVFLMLTGLVRQAEVEAERRQESVWVGPVKTKYFVPIPTLHEEVQRPERLRKKSTDTEKAEFAFPWLTAAGTPVFFAAIVSMLFLRMNWTQIVGVARLTLVQMKIPIPTIACMLGLSYVTRYAGMDATLGVAFAETGWLYPYFAAILGWLGVFLTGTDAGSNALFGSLQKITATELVNAHTFPALATDQAQILICTANSTGGVMGKMIDAQSICVATAGTNQVGREADIFKAVIWHSIFLASVVGLMTLVQAYVIPFTGMVPHAGAGP